MQNTLCISPQILHNAERQYAEIYYFLVDEYDGHY